MSVRRFNLIEASLDRAFSLVLTRNEHVLTVIAREQSYTEARRRKMVDPLPFSLDIDAISLASGVSRSSLFSARKSLLADSIFIPAGETALLINKDFESWTGDHALTQSQILWASVCPETRTKKSGKLDKETPISTVICPKSRTNQSEILDFPVRDFGQTNADANPALFTNRNRTPAPASEDLRRLRRVKNCASLSFSLEQKNNQNFDQIDPDGEFRSVPERTPRDPEDQAAIMRAINLLDPLRFQNILDGISNFADGPALRGFEGWRFEAVAARYANGDFLKPSTWKFAYFKTLLRDAEPISLGAPVSTPSAPAPGRKLNEYEAYAARMLAIDPTFFDDPAEESK